MNKTRRIPLFCAFSAVAGAFVATGCSSDADSERQRVGREFHSIPECVDFIRDDLGERLKIMTDKPTAVSGNSAANGLFFVCDVKETGTRGRVISGRWDRIPDMSFSEAEAKELISAAKEHTAKQFNDPATAEFEGLYVASRGSVCGKVSAKDQFGAPFGPRDFIFTSNKLVYLHGSMPEDDFALYARLQCQRPRADQ